MSRRQGVATERAVIEMEVMQEGRDRLLALPILSADRILAYWLSCHQERIADYKKALEPPQPMTAPGTP